MFSATLLTIAPITDVSYKGKHPRHETTIDTLSDDVLLDIFDFCKKNHDPGPRYKVLPEAVWDWQILVHVCQRWRQVISASPLRLNLRILCAHGTSVRKNLDVWPTIPLHIEYFYPRTIDGIDEDNVIAALGHPDCVSSICFALMEPTGPQSKFLRKMVMVMQEPFLALTHLFLSMLTLKDVAILGKICTMSTENHINQHSLSGISSASFVHQSSCLDQTFRYTPDWIHST